MQDALEMCLKMLSRSLGAGLLLGSLNLSPPGLLTACKLPERAIPG